MEDPRFEVWREVLIPFLDDQRSLDQLWCSSKTLQFVILNKLRDITCFCRPMDAVIKKRGIYPSYIGSIRSLHSVVVKLEPRLEETWNTFTSTQCTAAELFSTQIPLTVERFDCHLWHISWTGMDQDANPLTHAQQRAYVSRWLSRFPNITLSRRPQNYVSNVLYSDINTVVEPANLPDLRFQYITHISIVDAATILAHLYWTPDQRLIAGFVEGVIELGNVNSATLEQANQLIGSLVGGIPGLSGLPTTARTLNYDDGSEEEVTVHNLGCGTLRQLFPNLQGMWGNAPCIPNGLRTYNSMGGRSRTPVLEVPALPASLTLLVTTWNLLDPQRLKAPNNLTELYLKRSQQQQVTSPIPVDRFSQLVKVLPATLKIFRVELGLDPQAGHHPGQILSYWTVENIAALPRALKTLKCVPSEWKVPGDQAITERIAALPPALTDLSLPLGYMLDPSELVLLPASLSSVIMEVNRQTALLVDQTIKHFRTLQVLDVRVTLNEPFEFPDISLPPTLMTLDINISDPFNKGWTVPLQRIMWPDKMDAISIRVDEGGLRINGLTNADVTIEQWSFPRQLTSLTLDDVVITQLPYIWPLGLRNFTCFGQHTQSTVSDSALSKVWPDFARKVHYMPHSTVCSIGYIEEINEEPVEQHTIMIHPHPGNGRPYLVRLG